MDDCLARDATEARQSAFRPAITTTQLERGAELGVLASAALDLRAGVLLDAPAGHGKSALLDDFAAMAGDLRLLRAAPTPLEQGFAYGVVRALLEAPVHAASEHVLAGAAGYAGRLLRGEC